MNRLHQTTWPPASSFDLTVLRDRLAFHRPALHAIPGTCKASVTMVLGLALTAVTASAQFSLPPLPSAGTPTGTTLQLPQASAAASLDAVDRALKANDYTGAVQHYRIARSIAGSDATVAPRLQSIRQTLTMSGIDAQLLDMPPALATPASSAFGPSTPTGPTFSPQGIASKLPTVADRKREALRLTAMGRAALDRGDVASAYRMAHQAQSLGVADTEFVGSEPRPWQLLLDAGGAARRMGLDVTQLQQPASPPAPPGGISQASHVTTAGGQMDSSAVQTAGGFSSPGAPSMVAPVQALAPLPSTTASSANASKGTELYRAGLDALSQGKQTEARDKFVEAWKFEADLDLETRRALQDKLTLMQPSRLPSTAPADGPLTPIQKAELEAQSQTRRLYREVTAELATANEKRTSAPLDAVDDLERLLRRVEGANVDEASKASLVSMVNRALAEQNKYVEANRADIELKLQNEAVRMDMATEAAREESVDEEISSLVESYNDLMDQERYAEAETIAKEVAELAPGSSIATSMFHSSRVGTRRQMDQAVRDETENGFALEMLDIGRTAIPLDPDKPFQFPEPRSWQDLSTRRSSVDNSDSRLSVREQEIKRRLVSQEVEVKYLNRPLGEVLDDLATITGVPIVIDSRALAAVRIDRDVPITHSINTRISLRSALGIILGDLDLTYVLSNDVLNVTSKEARRTMVENRVYGVADLVTPIPNFVAGYEDGLSGALKAAYQMINPQTDVQIVPVSATDLGGGMAGRPTNSPLNPNVLGQYASGGGFAGGGLGAAGALRGGAGGGSLADFDSLIQLIQTTVEPDSWEALGGVGTMAPYPQNLSLVISTTSDVHDQIVDLLESLRRLQNLQITIEVRFITLADTFFEQIGIDFDVRFDDNAQGIPADDSGRSVTIGLQQGASAFGPGLPTTDLDIAFNQNSSGVQPPFGFDAGAVSSLGFAILSDIEAYFFLNAAQGDTRSNIMQAPKVTLFDGQIASISDQTSRPFVTSVIPVVGDFAVAQQPVIVVLDEGTKLNVQAVVSDDKRFVRLTLVPTFSQIGQVDTFTFQGSQTSRRNTTDNEDTNGDGVIDDDDVPDTEDEQETSQGTTVQQPTFAFTTVSTTVSVPDGGTILLGGIKRMSEGRSERGVPFLSKIPYVSRLFRNVAVGRTSNSLMLMVTPRIIIQEEEELAQTGFLPNR